MNKAILLVVVLVAASAGTLLGFNLARVRGSVSQSLVVEVTPPKSKTAPVPVVSPPPSQGDELAQANERYRALRSIVDQIRDAANVGESTPDEAIPAIVHEYSRAVQRGMSEGPPAQP